MTAALAPFAYDIRRAVVLDVRFITESTAKVRQPRDISWREYERRGMRDAEEALKFGQAHVVEADGVLLGFVIMTGDVVTMLYVKRDFRGLGLGIGLLTAAGALDDAPNVRCYAPTESFRLWCRRKKLTMVRSTT